MRLLFVCTHHAGGGLETSFAMLARAMHKRGHEVIALVRKDSHIDRMLGNEIEKHFGIFKGAADPRGLLALSRTIKATQPEWMISPLSKEYWPVTIFGLMNDVKVALFKHTQTVLRKGSRRLLPRLADRFIVISEHMRRFYHDLGITNERIQVLYNPFDFTEFKADPAARTRLRRENNIADDDFVIGYVGAMNDQKGIFVLAKAINQAMQSNKKIHSVWIGPGGEDELKRLFNESAYPAQHHYLGWANKVAPFYAMMDLLALPTIGTETFGRVCIEAAACGVPSLGSRVGGIPEAIQDGKSGDLLPPGDVTAWANAITRHAADAAYHQAQAKYGPVFAREHFSDDIIASEFEKMIS